MRRLNYILILLCGVFLSFGCDHKDILPEGEDHNVIIVPEGSPYIYLDAMVDNVTRGTLIEGNELKEGFGAYGYYYDFTNRWTTYRITATPNVFTKVDGDFIAPQEVTYTNGVYSYQPVKTWAGGKYTFFAYYPFGNSSVTPSGVGVQGTPYVTYAPENFLTSTANHADVMTAMFQDTSLSSSQYVDFDFQHRLSAIEVVALNFYEFNYKGEGDKVNTEKIAIEITDLVVSFTNLDYKAAKFYLDNSLPSDYWPIEQSDVDPSYDIVDDSRTISYSISSEFQRVVNDKDNPQVMLVIPQQDEDLKATINVDFKKRRPDDRGYLNEVPEGEGVGYVVDNDKGWTYSLSKTVEFGQALKAGSRYYIQLTFTSAAVSINILTSAEWEDLTEDVYHEFE